MERTQIQERLRLLTERQTLLREYLMRPLQVAKDKSKLSIVDIKKHQVLPQHLWKEMQLQYFKTSKEIETLTAQIVDHGQNKI
jgi:hypothetical protein